MDVYLLLFIYKPSTLYRKQLFVSSHFRPYCVH